MQTVGGHMCEEVQKDACTMETMQVLVAADIEGALDLRYSSSRQSCGHCQTRFRLDIDFTFSNLV